MTYKKRFGNYEVSCLDGGSKWFKDLHKAQGYFKALADALACDLDGTGDSELVVLVDLRTGAELDRRVING